MTTSEDFTLVTLSPRAWARLADLWSRPPGIHTSGGFQDRVAAWKATSDPAGRTVWLSHTASGRRTSDMTFIANAITGKLQGGWQAHIARIFEDAHAQFSNLPIRPKRR